MCTINNGNQSFTAGIKYRFGKAATFEAMCFKDSSIVFWCSGLPLDPNVFIVDDPHMFRLSGDV